MFLQDLDSKLLQGYLCRNCTDQYHKLTEIFVNILNHHIPLKEKQRRSNHALFMTKELSKAIMEKSKSRNKYMNSSGKKPSSLGDCLNASQDELTVTEIISIYSNHPST